MIFSVMKQLKKNYSMKLGNRVLNNYFELKEFLTSTQELNL